MPNGSPRGHVLHVWAKHRITKDSDDKCPHEKASACDHERKWMDEGKNRAEKRGR